MTHNDILWVTMQKFITIQAVAEVLAVSRSTICRWVAAGTMPAPTRIGRRLVRWPAATIEAWLLDGCPQAIVDAAVEQSEQSEQQEDRVKV